MVKKIYASQIGEVAKDRKHKHYIKNKERYKTLNKRWVDMNKEEYRAYQNTWMKNKNKELKQLIYDHYGEKCNCCGEENKLFLTIDHINNDGHKEKDKNGRRVTSEKMMRKIVKENFPDTFQILCYNCNCGKARNGGICPHVSNN